MVSLNVFFSKIIYINATFTSRHYHKSCYQHHLSDYQVILVSQRETSKQKGHRVHFICLQSIFALTQGPLPSSACSTSYRAYTYCTHWPATRLDVAQPVGPALAPCVGVDGHWQIHLPHTIQLLQLSTLNQAICIHVAMSFHPKECCLSGHLDKDSCPLNIQGGATYKAHPSFCLFPQQTHCTCFFRKWLLQPNIWLTKPRPRINYSCQDMDTGAFNS